MDFAKMYIVVDFEIFSEDTNYNVYICASKIYVYELQIRSMIAGVFVSLMSALIVSMVTLF